MKIEILENATPIYVCEKEGCNNLVKKIFRITQNQIDFTYICFDCLEKGIDLILDFNIRGKLR